MSTTTINIIITNGAAPHPTNLNRAEIHDHLHLTASDSELPRPSQESVLYDDESETVLRTMVIPADLHVAMKRLAKKHNLTVTEISRILLQRYIDRNINRVEQNQAESDMVEVFASQPTNATAMIPVPGTSFKQIFIKHSTGFWKNIDHDLVDLDASETPRVRDRSVLPQPQLHRALLSDADMARLAAQLTDKH